MGKRAYFIEQHAAWLIRVFPDLPESDARKAAADEWRDLTPTGREILHKAYKDREIPHDR
jgi:hypothetical protein